jgi:tRNA pseudouridine38-40 synthase
MARYKLILAYDGTHFQGFQRQGAIRTVQGEVEAALRSLGWTGTTILSAGRTDAGVHARGQVIACDLEWAHLPAALGDALNNRLPADVAVQQVERVAEDFHPRYDAVERAYRYRIYLAGRRDPLRECYAWRLAPKLEASSLAGAAALLQGKHDFAAFGAPLHRGGSTVRYLYSAGWQAAGDELVFEVRGNAFLYHMVRRMVQAQVCVAQGRLSLEQFQAAVEERGVLPPGLAPAYGLVLLEVRYAANRQEAERLIQTLL